MTAEQVHRLSRQVTDTGTRAGAIHVSTVQSANYTASTAISTFVASAKHDATAIGKSLDETVADLDDAAGNYTEADDFAADQLRRAAGIQGAGSK